jgi:hypothetical protein
MQHHSDPERLYCLIESYFIVATSMCILAITPYSMELYAAGWIIVTGERKVRSLQQRNYITGVSFLFRSVEHTQVWWIGIQMKGE